MKSSTSSQKKTVSYRRLHIHCFQFVLQALLSTLEEDTPILDTTSVLHSGTLQIAWWQGRADPAHQEIRTAHYLQKQTTRKEPEEGRVGSSVPEGLTDTQQHKVQLLHTAGAGRISQLESSGWRAASLQHCHPPAQGENSLFLAQKCL